MPHQVSITSPRNAIVITLYAIITISGGLFQSGAASASVLEEVWPHAIYSIWASVMLVAGVACLGGVIMAPRMTDPSLGLKVEALGCFFVVATLVPYEWSLAVRGFQFALTTQMLVVAIGLGCFFRIIQIVVDLVRVSRAVKDESRIV